MTVKSVLIVEDEKMIRQGIRAMIQRSGVPVEVIMECGNGEMALEILQTQQIDVMFTDIRMSKMNGIELMHRVQELEHQPLTVVISGYADFSYAVEMMRLGVREYLLKPIEREKLQEALQKLEKEIAQRQANSQNSRRLGWQQLKYIMLNEQITEAELDTMQKEYGSEFDLHRFCVCALNPREADDHREQYVYLQNIEENDVYLVFENNVDFLAKNELANEYVGVSALHSGIKEIRAAYIEAQTARQRAFCTNQNMVSFDEEEKRVPQSLQDEAAAFTETESRIRRVQLLGTDKTEEIVRIWNGFFYVVKNGRIRPGLFRECMDHFFAEVKKTYRNILADDADSIRKLSACYGFANIDSYEAEFMEWMLSLHRKINSQFDTNKNKQKIRQAMDYIQENYDKDLNMAVVSNYISMNYSLFSYSFKEYTGSNFVNYLKGIRMDAAKKLLEETDMLILEISQKVGYDNEKHFMKIFKAAVGVSPSEYRKNKRL